MNKEKTAFTADENDILMMADKIRQNQEEDKLFSASLKKFLDSSKNSTDFLHIGNTPNVLVIAGADPSLEVVISPKTIVKCMAETNEHYHGHGLGQEIMEQLPQELRNPVMVFKGSEENSLVAITSLKDKENREIMIAVNLNDKSKRHEVNRISSMYGRSNMKNYLQAQIEKNNLIAVNKEKADEMLQSAGLQLPLEETFINFNDSIAYTTENVKYPEQENYENLENGTKILRDKNGRITYHEDSSGNWEKYEYDEQGREIYYENEIGYWQKYEYNEQGKLISESGYRTEGKSTMEDEEYEESEEDYEMEM